MFLWTTVNYTEKLLHLKLGQDLCLGVVVAFGLVGDYKVDFCERLHLCFGCRNVLSGMWKNVFVWSVRMPGLERGGERALGFELKKQKQARGLNVGTRRAPEQVCGSSVVLICELLLSSGLFRNGLKAASALRLRASGAAHCSTFTQVTGECSIVDLLEVLLDFTPGMFK